MEYKIKFFISVLSFFFFTQLFSTLKEKEPTFRNRIISIEGDCSLPNLGISIIDSSKLVKEVSIIFHVAATVRFNEGMKSATAINVRSLKDLINLSKNMPKLKVRIFLFVSQRDEFRISEFHLF